MSARQTALIVVTIVAIATSAYGSIGSSEAPARMSSTTLESTWTATSSSTIDGPPIIGPPIRNITNTVPLPATASCGNPVPASAVYQAYQRNIAAANLQYGGKTVCLSGEILGVTNFGSGVHESCDPQNRIVEAVYGTSCATESGIAPNNLAGYVVWFWNGTAGQMGLGNGPSSVIGDCTVGGLLEGNLILRGCYIVDVVSTVSTTDSLINLTGLELSNATFYISSQTTARWVNMTIHVVNRSPNIFSFVSIDIPGYLETKDISGPLGLEHFALTNSSVLLNASIPTSDWSSLPSPGQKLNATLQWGWANGAGPYAVTLYGAPDTSTVVPAEVVAYTRQIFGTPSPSIVAGSFSAVGFRATGSTPTFTCAPAANSYLNLTDASTSHLTIANKGLIGVNVVDVEVDSGSQSFRYTPATSCVLGRAGSAASTAMLFFPDTSYFPTDVAYGQSLNVLVVLDDGGFLYYSGIFG